MLTNKSYNKMVITKYHLLQSLLPVPLSPFPCNLHNYLIYRSLKFTNLIVCDCTNLIVCDCTNLIVCDCTNLIVCDCTNLIVCDCTNLIVCDCTNLIVCDCTNLIVCDCTNLIVCDWNNTTKCENWFCKPDWVKHSWFRCDDLVALICFYVQVSSLMVILTGPGVFVIVPRSWLSFKKLARNWSLIDIIPPTGICYKKKNLYSLHISYTSRRYGCPGHQAKNWCLTVSTKHSPYYKKITTYCESFNHTWPRDVTLWKQYLFD